MAGKFRKYEILEGKKLGGEVKESGYAAHHAKFYTPTSEKKNTSTNISTHTHSLEGESPPMKPNVDAHAENSSSVTHSSAEDKDNLGRPPGILQNVSLDVGVSKDDEIDEDNYAGDAAKSADGQGGCVHCNKHNKVLPSDWLIY